MKKRLISSLLLALSLTACGDDADSPTKINKENLVPDCNLIAKTGTFSIYEFKTPEGKLYIVRGHSTSWHISSNFVPKDK